MLGRIEWAAVGKQVFPGRPAITPQIAMKPATLCFVFDPGFVRSAYVRLCVDSERSVSSGPPGKNALAMLHDEALGAAEFCRSDRRPVHHHNPILRDIDRDPATV